MKLIRFQKNQKKVTQSGQKLPGAGETYRWVVVLKPNATIKFIV
jgi:hypothetical protein